MVIRRGCKRASRAAAGSARRPEAASPELEPVRLQHPILSAAARLHPQERCVMPILPLLSFFLLLVLAPFAAHAETVAQPNCGAPATSEDGWQTAAPDAVGLDPAIICAIAPRFEEWRAADVHAVLVIRHGKLAYEQYFAGEDEFLGRPLGRVAYDVTMKHDLRSITKSVTSLVLGIEIGKGLVGGVD